MLDFTSDQIERMIWDGLLEIYEEEKKTDPEAVFHGGRAMVTYPCNGLCITDEWPRYTSPHADPYQWVTITSTYDRRKMILKDGKWVNPRSEAVKNGTQWWRCFNLNDPDLFLEINEFLNASRLR